MRLPDVLMSLGQPSLGVAMYVLDWRDAMLTYAPWKDTKPTLERPGLCLQHVNSQPFSIALVEMSGFELSACCRLSSWQLQNSDHDKASSLDGAKGDE